MEAREWETTIPSFENCSSAGSTSAEIRLIIGSGLIAIMMADGTKSQVVGGAKNHGQDEGADDHWQGHDRSILLHWTYDL